MDANPNEPLVGEAAKAGKPVEVQAVASMTSAGKMGDGVVSGRLRAQLLQKVMSDAVLRACEDGFSVSNPDHVPEFKARMAAARLAAVEKLNEYDAAMSKKLSE